MTNRNTGEGNHMNKKELRSYVLSLREGLTEDEIKSKSLIIADRLLSLSFYFKAAVIMAYMDYKKEVRTLTVIERAMKDGKRVVLPLTKPDTHELILVEVRDLNRDIATGFKGIKEPVYENKRIVAPGDVDLILVPGVVFDERGYRIGYGGGYYDRFLNKTCATKIGLAFELQIHPVPEDVHDVRVDYVVTEKRTIECN
ncbi:5-formyltetrahydrofolate cyclo-ligase [Calorimonas adulescens]|uniref:5-formyltetrahydrofolate cyclo-ligase n=2 Tax=Calorimonas adulescens TaxID=2606906 RepID=A0A5D8QEL6_9THEO|nr:5-formyltetrahydrofolate cyclo-ligase [Calorimonas adulescens]